MDLVNRVSQAFIKSDSEGNNTFVLVKITDNLLFSGITDVMNYLFTRIRQMLEVSIAIIYGPINFKGENIDQDDHGTIRMVVKTYLDGISPIGIARDWRKKPEDKATNDEYCHYWTISGEMMWVSNGGLLYASFIGSSMQ